MTVIKTSRVSNKLLEIEMKTVFTKWYTHANDFVNTKQCIKGIECTFSEDWRSSPWKCRLNLNHPFVPTNLIQITMRTNTFFIYEIYLLGVL